MGESLEKQDEQEKSSALVELLRELSMSKDFSKESTDMAQYWERLEAIYYDVESGGKANFRHRYSEIYSVLSDINEEAQAAKQDGGADANTGNLIFLTENLQTIKDSYRPRRYDIQGHLIDVSKEIAKLWDHVNLDKSRIDYTNTIMENTNARMAELEERIEKITKATEKLKEGIHKSDEMTKKLDDVQRRMEGMQREYITILGIFAAIVLAFTGGMSFTSSVLESIASSPPHSLLLSLFAAGIVLFNLLWLLINLIFVVGIAFACIAYKMRLLPL